MYFARDNMYITRTINTYLNIHSLKNRSILKGRDFTHSARDGWFQWTHWQLLRRTRVPHGEVGWSWIPPHRHKEKLHPESFGQVWTVSFSFSQAAISTGEPPCHMICPKHHYSEYCGPWRPFLIIGTQNGPSPIANILKLWYGGGCEP